MFRTHTCGELRIAHVGQSVTLAGWVQRSRKMGGMTFIDLRDRYGITQLVFNEETDAALCERANKLGREYVLQVKGIVAERYSKNDKMPTGDIEINVSELTVLNASDTPPFTIEENTDGGDDLRMKYRYLDIRRSPVRSNLELRHKFAFEVRRYLDEQGFLEIETPILVNSTPEGARDFVVPSRRVRRPSSNSVWWQVLTATSKSASASATKTCVPTASPSSRRLTARCPS